MSTTVDRDLLRAERSARIRTERLRRQMPLLASATSQASAPPAGGRCSWEPLPPATWCARPQGRLV